MTVTMLLFNTIRSAERRVGIRDVSDELAMGT